MYYDTGLEMEATRSHVKETAEKYGVEIFTYRPKIGIVGAVRKYGLPFIDKNFSEKMSLVQAKDIPFSVRAEYDQAEDKAAKRRELGERYHTNDAINFICGCDSSGADRRTTPFVIDAKKYAIDFMVENPPPFKISAKCCKYCKKAPAHTAEKNFDMVITGERKIEGGVRAWGQNSASCFSQKSDGQYRLKPLFFVTDADKAWYKEYYRIKYSDAYEVYGFKRTGCCGCPINIHAIEDMERLKPYEPNLYKAAWNVFGESYLYRQKYLEYRTMRKEQVKADRKKKA